jgi:hypothetical protein
MRTQTATEYLIIVAVVIIIALITVTSLSGITSVRPSNPNMASLYPFSIMSWTNSDTAGTYIILQNKDTAPLLLKNFATACVNYTMDRTINAGAQFTIVIPGSYDSSTPFELTYRKEGYDTTLRSGALSICTGFMSKVAGMYGYLSGNRDASSARIDGTYVVGTGTAQTASDGSMRFLKPGHMTIPIGGRNNMTDFSLFIRLTIDTFTNTTSYPGNPLGTSAFCSCNEISGYGLDIGGTFAGLSGAINYTYANKIVTSGWGAYMASQATYAVDLQNRSTYAILGSTSPTAQSLYWNNVLIANASNSSSVNLTAGCASPIWYIGSRAYLPHSHYLNGTIGPLIFVNGSLTATERTMLYSLFG